MRALPGGDGIELVELVDPVDRSRWLVDLGFLGSNWRCIWGDGCEGILDRPAAELGHGCCSVGAELLDEAEARTIGALGLTLDPARFQYHAEAAVRGVLGPDRRSTSVVDGACIFLNRPGFDGGAGCALHLGALDDEDEPLEWKPAVCWQLPLRVVRRDDRVELRRWRRADWGPGGETMAWCCTEEPETLVGDQPVVASMARELEAIVGPEVMVQIRRRIG